MLMSSTVYQIEHHFVGITTYRYKILTVDVTERERSLGLETCEAFDARFFKGRVSKDHVHILLRSLRWHGRWRKFWGELMGEISLSAPYRQALNEIKKRIHSAQTRAVLAVNRELLDLYWHIGRSIVALQKTQG